MNKFLDSTKCIYSPTTYENIEPGQHFTLKINSIFGYIKTNKKEREVIFHGGRWTGGSFGTLVEDSNAEYVPTKYSEEKYASIDLVTDEKKLFNKDQRVYSIDNLYYLSNLKYVSGFGLKGDDSYMLELARKQLKNDYGVDIGDIPRNNQSTMWIRRDNGIYQCKECGKNVGKNFVFCPWCGRKGMIGIG